MSILNNINAFRRKLMHNLTKNIGRSGIPKRIDSPISVKRVLISRPNHRLGNLLLISPLIQEVAITFPGCKIDLFTKGNLAPILYENYDSVDRIIRLPKKHFKELLKYIKGWFSIRKYKYDLVICAEKGSSSGRLSVLFAKSKFKVFGDVDESTQLKIKDYQHIAKYPVYSLRSYLTHLGFENDSPVSTLDLKLTPSEIANGKKIIHEIVDEKKPTICIFTFATGAKCYSEEWWNELYEKMKDQFKNYNILEMLPVENVSQIGFKAPTLYSKDIREMSAVMANMKVFIGADSGIMHLASASKVPTVGLFSVTNENMYRPYGNNSLALDTNTMDADGIIEVLKKFL